MHSHPTHPHTHKHTHTHETLIRHNNTHSYTYSRISTCHTCFPGTVQTCCCSDAPAPVYWCQGWTQKTACQCLRLVCVCVCMCVYMCVCVFATVYVPSLKWCQRACSYYLLACTTSVSTHAFSEFPCYLREHFISKRDGAAVLKGKPSRFVS